MYKIFINYFKRVNLGLVFNMGCIVHFRKGLLLLTLLSLSLFSCNKLVDVEPPVTSLTTETLYQSDATACAVMTGLYSYMSIGSFPFATGINSISIQSGLSSDELTLYSGVSNLVLMGLYKNALTSQICPVFWQNLYHFLHTINSALEGLNNSSTISPGVKRQLMGEAKFMRAFCNFYLINLYGDIPLVTTSNYQINASLSRIPKAQVYQQIIADLKEAQINLSDSYVAADAKSPTADRVRPNKWAATALLARTYLYTADYENAEKEATSIITKNSIYDTVPLNSIFLKNSKEAIWQLQPVSGNWNTEDARVLILPANGPNSFGNPVYVSNNLVNSFENGDQRKINWMANRITGGKTYYYANKYKSAVSGAGITEYLMVFRLTEQYLIRSEARVQKNNLTGAASDLNVIRRRAGLLSTSAISQIDLISAIQHERQVELFTEWGHRWLDLQRTGSSDTVMNAVTSQKGGTWNNYWKWYPIPLGEIQRDPNLIQNQGY